MRARGFPGRRPGVRLLVECRAYRKMSASPPLPDYIQPDDAGCRHAQPAARLTGIRLLSFDQAGTIATTCRFSTNWREVLTVALQTRFSGTERRLYPYESTFLLARHLVKRSLVLTREEPRICNHETADRHATGRQERASVCQSPLRIRWRAARSELAAAKLRAEGGSLRVTGYHDNQLKIQRQGDVPS